MGNYNATLSRTEIANTYYFEAAVLYEETDEGCTIYLIAIYDKSEESTITKKDLLSLVKNAFE